MLDAFDESKAASEDSSHAINELLNITKNYYKVVISCRTQFFNAVNEEPQILRLKRAVLVEDEMFVKHYICPFTDYEVLLYLLKYYKLNFRKIFRGKQVIKNLQILWQDHYFYLILMILSMSMRNTNMLTDI